MTTGQRRGAEPVFDAAFREQLETLFQWRRDVRKFRPDPVPPECLERLLEQVALAPPVGYSQPWRFVLVEDPARRRAVRADFLRCNADALAVHHGERARPYDGLKLDGLDHAPVHITVSTATGTDSGHGIAPRTQPPKP